MLKCYLNIKFYIFHCARRKLSLETLQPASNKQLRSLTPYEGHSPRPSAVIPLKVHCLIDEDIKPAGTLILQIINSRPKSNADVL
jgi:hypothetical protein